MLITRRPRTAPERHFAWLLWLALLLPLAQVASACHAISHAVGEVEGDALATKPAHCAMCTLAAEVGAGALPEVSTPLVLPSFREARAPWPAPELGPARLALAYLSRAPPRTVH